MRRMSSIVDGAQFNGNIAMDVAKRAASQAAHDAVARTPKTATQTK